MSQANSVEPKSILVRAPNWIGDQVMAYPFFYHLRKRFPKAFITSVCVPWVRDVQFMSCVDDVFVLSASSQDDRYRKFLSIGRDAVKCRETQHLKEGKLSTGYDLAISLPDSASAHWFLYRSGGAVRIGFPGETKGVFLTDSMQKNSEHHRAQNYLDLIPGLNNGHSVRSFFRVKRSRSNLQLEVEDEEEHFECTRFDWRSEWFPNEVAKSIPQIAKPFADDYFVIAPGAVADSRRWGVGEFQKLSSQIISSTGYRAIIVGGKKEMEQGLELERKLDGHAVSLCGEGSVTQFSEIFENAKWTICNESGLAHVASLMGSPTHIVCGAANPKHTYPLGPGQLSISVNPIPCWPCERNVCKFKKDTDDYLACIRGIHSNDVFESMKAASENSKKKSNGNGYDDIEIESYSHER